MGINIIEQIQAFNTGRAPHLLEVKYHTMRDNIFCFYRGVRICFTAILKKLILSINVLLPGSVATCILKILAAIKEIMVSYILISTILMKPYSGRVCLM